jgi:hypothetical protein
VQFSAVHCNFTAIFEREKFRATYMSNTEFMVKLLCSLVTFRATVYISPLLFCRREWKCNENSVDSLRMCYNILGLTWMLN